MDLRGLIKELKKQGITDVKVIESIKKIDRKLFVPEELKKQAYDNTALQLKQGQTISQPYTIAIMLQALELRKNLKVLEIGAGSGYNAALISYIIFPGKVYTTEIIPELVELAQNNIKKIKPKKLQKNIEIIKTDGSKGLRVFAFYDRIIVTAACPGIPDPLIEQLSDNGILVAPVGSRFSQSLIKLKKENGKITKENLGEFIFVPLTGKYGY